MMGQLRTAEQAFDSQDLVVSLAANDREVEQALRLRYQVFVEEERNLQMRNASGLETDAYDVFCDHLIVKDRSRDEVVGTYRLLPGDRALAHIGFYSETEFDLSSFAPYRPRSLEVGRSCVAHDYRNGRTIQMLWEGIHQYITMFGYAYLIGCASVTIPSKEELCEIYTFLRQKEVLTDRFGVQPLSTHRIQGLRELEETLPEKEVYRKLPPLMKGYQWLGAEIGGEPAYDPIFQTVDFFIVLEHERMSRRYRRRLQSKES